MSIGLTESYIRLQPCCVAEIASYCVVSQTHERCLYLPPPFTSWHLVCHVIEAYLHRNCIEITWLTEKLQTLEIRFERLEIWSPREKRLKNCLVRTTTPPPMQGGQPAYILCYRWAILHGRQVWQSLDLVQLSSKSLKERNMYSYWRVPGCIPRNRMPPKALPHQDARR